METGAKFLHAFDASESAHLATFREWIYWRVLPNPDSPTPDNN